MIKRNGKLIDDVMNTARFHGREKMAAAEKQWYVGEDGCISVGEPTNSVTYHSALNSIIVSTKEPSVKIYDVASGAILQKSCLSAQSKDQIRCLYLPGKDKVAFCDDYSVGVRSDLRGMLLLDTSLQSPVSKAEDLVRIELPLAEASQLLKSLMSAELPGIDHVDEVVKELEKGIDTIQDATKGNLKTSKWATVCIQFPHATIKGVCSSLVTEMKRLTLYNPGLSVASAISDRLSYLLPNQQPDGSTGPLERALMYSEAARQETFKKWPHMNYKWALPDPMAQAGFYHQPNSIGDDRAMCFTCNVCLVCWEPTDEPWSEHERHSPACPFVKGEYTQNVPLSVTYATQPARRHGENSDKIECLSTTSSDDFIATSTINGNITVWNVNKMLKKHCQFNLDPTATAIAMKTGLQIERSSGVREIQTQTVDMEPTQGAQSIANGDVEEDADVLKNGEQKDQTATVTKTQEVLYEIPLHSKADKTEGTRTRTRPCEDVKVKSLCVLRKPAQEKRLSVKESSGGAKSKRKSRSYPQPTLVCGASLRRTNMSLSNREVQNSNSDFKTEVQIMNEVNDVVSCDSHPRIIPPEEEDEEDGSCQDELLSTTSFVPHILLLAVKDDSRKSTKLKEKESKKSTNSGSVTYINMPTLGPSVHVPTSNEWGPIDPMFDSDPDPDVQIIGVTPGTVNFVESPTTVLQINNTKEPSINAMEGEASKSEVSSKPEEPLIKSTPVVSKTRAGAVLQCIELPASLQSDNYEISHIVPTSDSQHVIVVVSPCYLNSSSFLRMNPVISDSLESNCDENEPDVKDSLASESDAGMRNDHPDSTSTEHRGGCILVYKYVYGDEYAILEESPVVVRYFEKLDHAVTSVLVLPQDVCDLQEDEEDTSVSNSSSHTVNKIPTPPDIHGQVAITLQSGRVWLLNVCDLSVVAEVVPPDGDKFVSATYCIGIERLCICTSDGKLHFYQLCDHSPPASLSGLLDSVDGLCNGDLTAEDTCQAKPETDSKEPVERNSPGSDLLAKQALTVENLMILHNLIQFENLMPRYTATVPPCWTEIQQEQQQRRHPQHLQHQGEATQHTRTWKLQQDSNTWEEHIFEIVLPRPCCVGHVDVKFTIHPQCSTPPDIQVTLLKQNITSIGRQPSTSSSTIGAQVDVDKGIDFSMPKPGPSSEQAESSTSTLDSQENNVLDPAFLQHHNAEIMCGPVSLSSCLDLSGNSGLITLTSPQLMSSKPKAFLLHLRGFTQAKPEETKSECKSKEPKKKMTPASQSFQKMKVMKTAFDNDLFVPPSVFKEPMATSVPRPKFPENLQGCDWIQEISVTIRKSKKTALPKERLQRNAMIDYTKFHERLITGVSVENGFDFSGVSVHHWQDMILDIMMWITAIQMNNPEKRSINKSLPMTIQNRLCGMVKACFIYGTRTTAHKCARLLAMCMDQCKQSGDPDLAPVFSCCLLQALLESLQLLPCANSSGAVRWFFTMLNRVKCIDTGLVAQTCVELLINTAKHYNDRMSPLHSLLKSRFGLYGQPFDPDLFDTDLPMALRQTIPSTQTYAQAAAASSGNNNNNSSLTAVADEMDFYDLFNPPSEKSTKAQLEYARSNVFGLLEVEPLHFTCHSTSDGTKMERLDISAAGHSSSLNTSGLSGTINFGETLPSQPVTTSTSTLASLSSSMAVTKQHVQELSNKSYPTFKHKINHIKQILSEVNKTISQDLSTNKNISSDQLLPPTPKTTPQVMTPPLTPPNETWHQNQGTNDKADILKQQYAQAQKSTLGIPNAQTLLQQPPLQVLVIERMHSGARRFVILDFGKPIVLTDAVIPACADLASLSIDVWVQGEEIDGQRFVVAGDIGSRSLIMNDIMPAPVCRYLKITTIGRYGSGSTRSKIPIGAFYGHSCILPWEWNSFLEQRCTSHSVSGGNQTELPTQSQLLAQLSVYVSLLEDIQCRYSLARTRLENLLCAVNTQQYASAHIQYYLKKQKKNDCDNKILQAYQDCLQLQLQQNLAQRATDRLHSALGFKMHSSDTGATLSSRLRQACTDKLRFLQESLLDTLLSMTTSTPSIPQPPVSLYAVLNPHNSEKLFKHLCVHGSKKIQISMGMLLMRVCGSQLWWGNFLGNVLQEFFHSENTQIFSQDRVFVLLLAMGQKALSGPCALSIMESLLDMLARVLSPLINGQQTVHHGQGGLIDLTLVGWILLFLCRNLDHSMLLSLQGEDISKNSRRENGNGLPNRWNFIQGDHNSVSSKSKVKGSKLYRWSMHKRLLHHKQKLMDLQQAQKTFFNTQAEKSSQSSSITLMKQQEKQFRKELSQYASKHIKEIFQMKSNVDALRKMPKAEDIPGPSKTNGDFDQDGMLVLPKEKTLRVVKGLMALLLSMDFTCNVDLFLVTCKVLATICVTTRPAITLAEAMNQEQLEKLILLASNLEFSHGNISWGGPWAGHAITCLLQDILDGEKFYPAHTETTDIAEECLSTVTETDDSLQNSVSLPTIDDTEQETTDIDIAESKDDTSKMNFDKESSMMVDLLLNGEEDYDDSAAKLHAYVTGESVVKAPAAPMQYETGMPTSSLNGTLEINSALSASISAEEKKLLVAKQVADNLNKAYKALGVQPNSGNNFGGFPTLTSSVGTSTAAGSTGPVNLPSRSSVMAVVQGMSTAVDARLEFGLETQSELRLKTMLSVHTENVQMSFSSPLPMAPSVGHSMEQSVPPTTDDELSEANARISSPETTSSEMLSQCYERLFNNLIPQHTNLDTLLQLWLTLNGESGTEGSSTQVTFDPSKSPLIPLSQTSMSNMMTVVNATPSLPICTWVLVFQTLTLLANQKIPSHTPGVEQSMVVAMLADSNLIPVIRKFLSGTSEYGPIASAAQFSQVGPSASKSFYEFLLRLLVKCTPENLKNLKELMLKLVYTLSAERGAFHCGLGPLDVQCKFMSFILDMSYENVDISNAMSVIESISILVHQHILCQERISCRSSSENNVNARSCFGGLFASLLRGVDSRSSPGEASRDLLMCSLLKLINSLMQMRCGPRNHRVASVALDTNAEPHTPTNNSLSEPVPDSAKLSQALATSTPTSFILSDDDKSQQTDEQKTENLTAAVDPSNTYLADIILGHRQIMCNLIQALSYCNSNTMAMILGSKGVSSQMQDAFTGIDPISVGDGIYQILGTLYSHCSDQKLVLESLFYYLSGSFMGFASPSLCRLSEPLLWFILKVLDSSRAIHIFLDMGGVEVVCRNLVNCNCRIINTSPSLISTIMQNLNGRTRMSDKRTVSTDTDNTEGLQNFAPLGSISSSSPTASPADVLIQSSQPHRRARSAAWSYHFYPDEAWVDLTINLPFAILLREVQIQPHNAALTTCPAFVSLEISHDGVTSTPLCQPLMTSSLAFIKLQLQRQEVANMVTIRLHKARDSMTIGLSQIQLVGYSAFGDTGSSPPNIFMPTEDYISRSSVRWIRLLHHCLTAHKEVESQVASAASPTPNLLNTCSALLVSPLSHVYAPNIETVLLKLGLHSINMGLALIDNILRSPTAQTDGTSGLLSPYLGKVSGLANDSTVELLYQLGTIQDSGTRHRVEALLSWLEHSAEIALQRASIYTGRASQGQSLMMLPSPAPTHIQCVAAILWYSHEQHIEYNLGDLISKQLVSYLYEWSSILKSNTALKKSVDYVLCSACHINPEFFSQLLMWMNITETGDTIMTASISDDRKDISHHNQESMTDDSKEANGIQRQQSSERESNMPDIPLTTHMQYRHMDLDESHLATLSLACKSPVAIEQLLDSGFPAMLAQGLFEFCSKVMSQCSDIHLEGLTDASKTLNDERCTGGNIQANGDSGNTGDKSLWITADIVAAVLNFFAEVSSEPMMKDWLGGAEGNIFWPAILTMLCNTPVQTASLHKHMPLKTEVMSLEERTSIETAAVRFFTQVTSCHIVNQLLFAKVLCEVIKEQSSSTKAGQSLGSFPLSGFTRCLFLQALLEDEKVLVAFQFNHLQQQRIQLTGKAISPVEHPKFTGGRGCHTVAVSLHTTCAELLHKISAETPGMPQQILDKASEKSDESKRDFSGSSTSEIADYISSTVASGKAAKDRREKEDKSAGKSSLPPRPPTRRGRHVTDCVTSQILWPVMSLYHPLLPNKALPGELTLSQLMQILQSKGIQQGHSVLQFVLKLESKKKESSSSDPCCSPTDDWCDSDDEMIPDESLLTVSSFPTALQVFASVGGLALLAEHLPLLYPEISRQPSQDQNGSGYSSKTMSNSTELQDWVTVEPFPEDFYELYEPVSPAPTVSRAANPSVAMPSIPPHSLVAFGLFLRLPGYAEVLLKERKKAQCLLRLVLGVTDDGDGGHILTSAIAGSLPTLPFLVLKTLYDSTPLTCDDGVLLRRMSLEIWVLHLILACLSVLSHHAPRVSLPGFQHEAQMILSAMQTANTPNVAPTVSHPPEEKSQQYWAKGTGFGTGSTTSSWDAEQALLRQKSEEEHVACLLQVLASYINPGGELPPDFDNQSYSPPSEKGLLPQSIPELLSQSCLVPAISSYLRNDSVLDMARHIPLYRALLELLRGIAVCPSLVPLLLPLDKENNTDSAAAVGILLDKMRGCVDTYASRLKSNKGKNGQSGEEEENEGLALLIPDIQETAKIVKMATERLQKVTESDNSSMNSEEASIDSQSGKESLDEKYMEVMKQLQFDTFELVVDDNGIKFTSPHHYESNVKAAGDISNAARTRRLAQEAVTLSTSLPLSAGSCVFVRCDEERLDIMKVLITGPADTPYESGCFEFDVYFPQDYPNSPPYINLETTGNHTIRFNPNLYNDGKVCLSVLNTWHGRPEEKWNPHTSSFLQVLVSIQSLILVSEPYFNEPGYERSRGTPSGNASSREYDANIRQATVKWAMLEQLKNPTPCFKEVVHKHFWLKRRKILKQCEEWITEMESYSSDKRTGRTIAHSTLALKRHYNQLREEFAKMKVPEGLEEEEKEDIDPKGIQYSTDPSNPTTTTTSSEVEVAGPSTQADPCNNVQVPEWE